MKSDRRVVWSLAVAVLALFATACAQPVRAAEAAKYVWIEAETPGKADVEIKTDTHELLSGGKSLHLSLLKKDVEKNFPLGGANYSWDFNVAEGGKHAFWLRLGFEFARAPLKWRIDAGPWHEVSPEDIGTNLMELRTWNEMAWLAGGDVDLKAGKHTVEINVVGAGRDGRVLMSLDCLAFVKGKFTPEGLLKPGQSYDAEIDRKAAAQVYGADGKPWADKDGRPQLELTGLWEVARWDDADMDTDTFKPVDRVPADDEYKLQWRGVDLIGDMHKKAERPEMRFAHRYLLRTKFKVPADYKGKGFNLHFTESAWILSVMINGQYVGGHTTVLVPWDIDLTPHLKLGEVNEIVLGVKSSWYAMDPTFAHSKQPSLDHCRNMPSNLGNARYWGMLDAVYCSAMMPNGLRGPVRVVATGQAHTSDIFIRTSLVKKRLEADVEVSNVTGKAIAAEVTCEAINDKSGKVEKTFGPAKLNVPAGGKATVALADNWANPKLWWNEPKAETYTMRTTVRVGGKVVDVYDDLFGFREVTIDGKDFLLNGIPFHGLVWQGIGTKFSNEKEWIEMFRKRRNTYIRTHGNKGIGKSEDTMDLYDREGIAQFCPTWMNGMFLNYECNNPVMWENMERHVRQYIKAYRNHPSILNWSLGNEFLLVNARLGYRSKYDLWEEKSAALVAAQIEVDPTRRSYMDGGGDMGGRIELDCNHYGWKVGVGFPACAYEYPTGPAVADRTTRDRAEMYLWTGDKPLIFGEVFHYQLGTPDMSWIGGPSVFRGVRHQDVAATRYMSIAVEGARWQGATGICLFGEVDGSFKDNFISYEPRAVFVREHNAGFRYNARLRRKIAIFNDTRLLDPLTLNWNVVLDGKVVGAGEKVYNVAPGRHEEDTIECKLPLPDKLLRGKLSLELSAKGKVVFADSKPIYVAPQAGAPRGFPRDTLVAFDPTPMGKLFMDLGVRSIPHKQAITIKAIPDDAKIVLIGAQTLDKRTVKQAGAKLRKVVLGGGTVIVLEQETPLQKNDLPVAGVAVPPKEGREPVGMAEHATAARGRSGGIAHPVAVAHPVLKGIAPEDLFTWTGDEFNFRRSYGTPVGGPIAIIQSGDGLGLTPMMEIPVGQGSYLLSQMLIGEKLGTEPTADRLLDNMLTWAAGRAGKAPGKTVVVDAADKLVGMLHGMGLVFELQDAPDEMMLEDAQVVIIPGNGKSATWLAENKDAVRDFCGAGGWVMVTDLDRKGLASFNKVVEFEHRIRKCRQEGIKIVERTDPLLLGLSDREFTQFDDTMIAPWVRKYWASDNVFTQVVDAEDIGGFVKCRYPNLFNGLTNVDFWRYTQYFMFEGTAEGRIDSGQGEKDEAGTRKGIWIDIAFDRAETIKGLNIQMSQTYYTGKDVKIVFDDDQKTALPFTLANNSDKQEIRFPKPRKAGKVSIVFLSHYGGISNRNMKIITVDLVEVLRQMPKGGPVALTNPGGLVKYPIGKGGILLNQLNYTYAPEPGTDKRQMKNYLLNAPKKKAINANLLRNMGAAFKVK
jgi:glycosyl hydrolase family 2